MAEFRSFLFNLSGVFMLIGIIQSAELTRRDTSNVTTPLSDLENSTSEPKARTTTTPREESTVPPTTPEPWNVTHANELFRGVFKKIQEKTNVLWLCTNEERQCLVTHDKLTFVWSLTSGNDTKNNKYKPKTDTTLMNATGKYMFTVHRGRDPWEAASMWTDLVVLDGYERACLEFWFYMDGPANSAGAFWLFKGRVSPRELIWEGADPDSQIFGVWGEWSPCSVTDGMGMRSRKRKCSRPTCFTETENCTAHKEDDNDWSDWNQCSVTCGRGYMQRSKGDRSQTKFCNEKKCEDNKKNTSCGVRYVEENLHNILGGNEAKPHSWPWQVLLLVDVRGKVQQHCGRIIISHRYVVTAAHCFRNRNSRLDVKDVAIRVGAHDNYRGKLYKLKREIGHPKYDPRIIRYDITILEVATEIEFSKQVSPICLPQQEPAAGTLCYATGWGKTSYPYGKPSKYLHEVRVKIIDRDKCSTYLHHIGEEHVCAGENTRLKGVYSGDSGGPLACEKDGRFYLSGVASFVHTMKHTPDVYTNVYHVKKWIRDVTGLE